MVLFFYYITKQKQPRLAIVFVEGRAFRSSSQCRRISNNFLWLSYLLPIGPYLSSRSFPITFYLLLRQTYLYPGGAGGFGGLISGILGIRGPLGPLGILIFGITSGPLGSFISFHVIPFHPLSQSSLQLFFWLLLIILWLSCALHVTSAQDWQFFLEFLLAKLEQRHF